MPYPDVRRAQSDDQMTVGDLWVQLLREQDELDDRFGVADNARERWDNDFPQWLDDETYRIYVAEADDEIVGFASAHRWGPPPIYEESSEVYLDELYVRPEDRRQGLATQLVNAVRDWTDRIGARRLRLNVLAANDAALDFWA
ncbi:MAG: N-acetyltransferase, partial [Bacteroidetes bacterium QH_1_64_81]